MIDWFDASESSTISRVGYDDQAQILIVEFKSTGLYNYFDVPPNVFEEMRAAPSRGQYLAYSVKGRYRYSRA